MQQYHGQPDDLEEEESLFNRKYMVWETSIKTGMEATHRTANCTVNKKHEDG